MNKRTRIIAGALGAIVLVAAGRWAFVPEVRTATAAEVRALVAPELLEPLPRPEGGEVRTAQLHRALGLNPGPTVQDIDHPGIRQAMGILAGGPLDRTAHAMPGIPPERFSSFVKGVLAPVPDEAVRGEWERVQRRMEMTSLLLDRLAESDADFRDAEATINAETAWYQAALALSGHHDLPAVLAGSLAMALGTERHGPQQVQQVVRGAFQTQFSGFAIPNAADARVYWGWQGSYDVIETITLINDCYVEAMRNAELPASRWSHAAAARMQEAKAAVADYPRFYARITRLWYEARANHAPNAAGRGVASMATYPVITGASRSRAYPDRLLQIRTRHDQVAAAVAVVRFRQRIHREPRDFAELVAAKLLLVAPLDHATDRPLPFDLAALFQWPGATRPLTRN